MSRGNDDSTLDQCLIACLMAMRKRSHTETLIQLERLQHYIYYEGLRQRNSAWCCVTWGHLHTNISSNRLCVHSQPSLNMTGTKGNAYLSFLEGGCLCRITAFDPCSAHSRKARKDQLIPTNFRAVR